MAVEVLSPQNCIKGPMTSNSNRNPNSNRVKRTTQPDRRNRRPTPSNSNSPPVLVQKSPAPKNLLMGQVKILKRGEEVPQKPATRHPPPKQNPTPQVPDLGSSSLLGPTPNQATPVAAMVHSRQTKPKPKPAQPNRASGFYAGSSMCLPSPPPSSLPLPSFFTKKSAVSNTDEAASELLKLLRLNLS